MVMQAQLRGRQNLTQDFVGFLDNCQLLPGREWNHEVVLDKYTPCLHKSSSSKDITMASRASQLGVLDLTDPEKAKVWLIAFAALARAEGWVDVPAENAETDDKLTITDNFIASCGIDALLKIRFIVAPDE